jgi:VIT1/CCC1 family predicted Fe2+/Mn2+ transporter
VFPRLLLCGRENEVALFHREGHRTQHIGWLRAAVLGANDGIVSTASLLVGVAASNATHTGVLVAGVAGLVAGALSMAAGEYVSVSSQSDTEHADIELERRQLAANELDERKELAAIYVKRGLDLTLANQVAEQLMAKDSLAAHTRDELGISETISARPVQAALTSALTFAVGAALPLLVVVIATPTNLVLLVAGTSLFFLALLGALAAYTGGARILVGIVRVTFWGALAMAITAGIGAWFGTIV